MASKDPFSINIVLHHPTYTPEEVSQSLSLEPVCSWSVGQKLVKRTAKWTFFYARLQQGDYASEFPAALKKVVRFIEKNSEFWPDFVGDGDVELVLNYTAGLQEQEGDKNFELHLTPKFLGTLSDRGISLRMQGWQGRINRKTSASRPEPRKRRSR